MGIKNAEFHADFESVDKVFRNAPKKVIYMNVMEIALFHFYSCLPNLFCF
jgi:hypothetical protein